MKRVINFRSLYIFSLLTMMCISCGGDEPTAPEEESGKIEYYVKYESSVNIPSSHVSTVNIEVFTEKGTVSLTVPKTWEGVFGPFYDLVDLFITSKTTGYNTSMTSCRGRISICRGNQPFILKADKSFKGTSYSVHYSVTEKDLE